MTDPRADRRRGAGLLAVLTAGCIATNPRWDQPDDADSAASATDDDDDGTDDASTSDDLGEVSSSGAAESSWTGSGEDSSSGALPSGDDEGPACEDGKIDCAGECKNTSKDRHACGPECLDCTVVLDSEDAVCEGGECRTDNSGPGGDDDD